MPKSKLITTEIVPVKPAEAGALSIETRMPGVQPAAMVQWLKQAVPAYLRTRERLVKEATLIGVVLIMVRDFSPRGTLETVKKMIAVNRSTRTLDRCIAQAQRCLAANKLLHEQSHKLIENEDVASIVQAEFDFDRAKHPLMAMIEKWAEDETHADVEEEDALGEAGAEMPGGATGGGRKKVTKAEAQRTAFSEAFGAFKKVWSAGREHLFNKDMIAVEVWLTKALDTVKAENRRRQRAEEKKGK